MILNCLFIGFDHGLMMVSRQTREPFGDETNDLGWSLQRIPFG